MTIATILAAANIWVPIAVVVLSSLVTGLSNYPKAGGAVAVIQRVLSLLSLVQHYDSPGSLKVPLLLPAKPASVVPAPAPRGVVPLIVIGIIAGIVAIGAAITALVATGHGKQALQCAETAIASQAASIETAVVGILGGSDPNWAAQLDDLAAKVGEQVVACAIEAVLSPGDGGAAAVSPLVHANGVAWLTSHSYQAK